MQEKQPNESQKNTRYQNVSKEAPVFTFILPGGRVAPLPPASYATANGRGDLKNA